MSEQVINIRDRIEKNERTQMTGPNESVARNKIDLEKKILTILQIKRLKSSISKVPLLKQLKVKKNDSSSIKKKSTKLISKVELKMFPKKVYESKKPMNPTLNLISLKFHQLVRHTKTTIMIIYMMRIKNLLD